MIGCHCQATRHGKRASVTGMPAKYRLDIRGLFQVPRVAST